MGYVLQPFEWIRIAWIRTDGIRMCGIRLEWICVGYVQCAGYVWWIRLKWICVGYVKCAGYVWDMCGVRYANNLLKNPATKRLSGKTYYPTRQNMNVFSMSRLQVSR